jgi:D-sedoheptulose 7-phosphate isomerase
MEPGMKQRIEALFAENREVAQAAAAAFPERLEQVVRETVDRLRRGGRIYLLGNGGSAADALHWAGELMGRFGFDRPGIPALALVDNPSVITAVANDLGYEAVFARQLDTLARLEDVVVAISTSGNSPNVLAALQAIEGRGCLRVGLTGAGGGAMAALVDVLFDVPSRSTPRIQEIHALLGHILCELIESELYGKGEWVDG